MALQTLTLTKHHGLGNDFLVLLDPEGASPLDADLARRLCDRHTGIGADGLLRASPPNGPGVDLTFELRNADGSEAEMSGNGMRCLVQAAVDSGWVAGPQLVVATPAGPRRVHIDPEHAPGQRTATVDMGPAQIGALDDASATISMGNPHYVLRVESLASIEADATDRNVEFVRPGPEPDAITMRVIERGVGETLACGTGACAAAVAAHQWGLVGTRVTVHQPGGDALVELKDDTVLLSGPTVRIATVTVDRP